jgi:hydrogenase maturation protease
LETDMDRPVLIIGLGNSLRSDDGVGPATLRLLAERLGGRPDVTYKELGVGGLRLMEEMIGFDRVFLVDAMVTGVNPPGTVQSLSYGDMSACRNVHCMHDMALVPALEVGRALGARLPRDIRIWGIEAAEVEVLGQQLTDAVARGAEQAAREMLEAVGDPGRSNS